jgi:hypothetical protein
MTKAVKARVLFAVLSCAPMGRSKEQFRQYADTGDVEALWEYYQQAIKTRPDIKRGVESSGEISFEMLKPAMEAIYGLPTKP